MNLNIAIVINENQLAVYNTKKSFETNFVTVIAASITNGAPSRTNNWDYDYCIKKNDVVRYATEEDFNFFRLSIYGWTEFNRVLIRQDWDRIVLNDKNYTQFNYPQYIDRNGEEVKQPKNPSFKVGELVYINEEGAGVVLGCIDEESEDLRTDLVGMQSFENVRPIFLSDYLVNKYAFREEIFVEIYNEIVTQIRRYAFFTSFEHLNDCKDQYPEGLYELYVAMGWDLENNGGDKYEKCATYKKLFENFGYTFDYGLDGEPIELKLI